MSISSLQASINRLQNDLSDLQKKISVEKKKESDATIKATKAHQSISKTKSQSTIKTKLSEISRCQTDIAKASKKQAELHKKIADKNKLLVRDQQKLAKETEKEQTRQLNNQASVNDEIRQELDVYKTLIRQSPELPHLEGAESYDLFISHASEDKESFVRPLANELERIGLKVWFDERIFKIGDSISGTIDKGILNSKFGVAILSQQFFSKYWTKYEYRGLLTRESQGFKVLLPIWYGINKTDVIQFSPTLADTYAFQYPQDSIEFMAKKLKELVDET
ncbi:TIR domain-containing protein [Paenibacillus sp. FSL L8-0340]|uniref:TIR domain-containing protein n=1 Tax=Paenibacillus sp. FSL L8-0340 TaxID=2954685 RepID=UPI003158B4FA